MLDDDSAGNRQFSLAAALVSRATIILVATTYSSGVTGDIDIIVSGPQTVTFAQLLNPLTTSTLETSITTITATITRRTTTTPITTTTTTRKTTTTTTTTTNNN